MQQFRPPSWFLGAPSPALSLAACTLVLATCPSVAHAEGSNVAATADAPPGDADEIKDADDTKEADPAGTLAFGGRVFAGAAFVTREQEIVDSSGVLVNERIDSLDLELTSARFKLEYQAPLEWLSAEIEMEFEGRPELKDAYVQARSKKYSVRAGQFKMPFSAFALESPWTLPLAHRGEVNDVVSDVLQVAGRRAGVSVGARLRKGIRPQLTLGAFQGSVLVDDLAGETEPASERFLPSQHGVARFTVKVGDLVAGVNYQHRMGTPEPFESDYYWTGGADLTLDADWESGGFRGWLEGVAGSTWLEHEDKPEDGEDATFVLVRAVAAPRFGGVEPLEFYVEPYTMASILDPDAGGVVGDLLLEVALGVNFGWWDLLRVGVQGEGVRAERNFPAAYHSGRNPERLAVLGHVGVKF